MTDTRERRRAELRALLRSADGPLRLEVSDEGRGLPEGFDPARHGGLGMELVRVLVRTLGAGLVIDRGRPGTCFAVLLSPPAARGAVVTEQRDRAASSCA